MDCIFALEISIIEYIQYAFEDYGWYFALVNSMTNPKDVGHFLFPLMSIFDSVFAAQLLLCLAFCSWFVGTLKGWIAEDRPYWWVNETSFYRGGRRPRLLTTSQTCMTGPGNPSSHSAIAAVEMTLFIMWSAHFMNDRKIDIWWWNFVLYGVCAFCLTSTMLARVYVVAHFPHQVLFGAAIGMVLTPALCRYISDPAIWGPSNYGPRETVLLHVGCAFCTGLISLATCFTYRMLRKDPYWTAEKAERWCCNRVHSRVAPFYWSVQNFSSLLGWALSVTPDLAKYRHYTKDRSIALSFILTLIPVYGFCTCSELLKKRKKFDLIYYSTLILGNVLKPILFLRIIPALSMASELSDVHKALWLYSVTAIGAKKKA